MRAQLERRQSQLIEVMDRVDVMLAEPSPPASFTLDELRQATGAMLADHFRFKAELFRRLRVFGIVTVDRQVARSRSAMLAFQVAYRFHCVDWDGAAIVRDWPGFAAAARRLVERMRVLVETDRAHLHPLIDQLLGDAVDAAAPAGPAAAQALALSFDRVSQAA